MKRPVDKALDKYGQKRSFARTPEPAPTLPARRHGPLLFIVQKHAARRLHYDFRLELDGVLKSWAVPKGPSLQVGERRLAVEVEDHPFDYASFEGVIPEKNYGAGNVIVWDCGVYSPDEGSRYSFDDRAEAEERLRRELGQGKLSFFLRGIKLKGSFALVRTSTDKQWLLIKHKDRFAGGDDLLAHNTSVLTGDTLDDVADSNERERLSAMELAPSGPLEKMPNELEPMLAEPGENLESDARWSFEPKLDGYRIIAFIAGGSVYLQSRRGQDYTALFPEVVADLEAQCVGSMILDGEIVALDADGRPSFNALQNRAQTRNAANNAAKNPTKNPNKNSTQNSTQNSRDIAEARRQSPVIFICFDLLHFAGVDLRGATYERRRRYLSQCLLPGKHLQLIHVSDDAERLHQASLAAGFEGTVAKRKDSPYQPGRRSPHWLKYKDVSTAEFVVGGFTKGKGQRAALGALLLGFWNQGQLQYVGHVGSGFDDAMLAKVRGQVTALISKSNPFSTKPPLNGPATWIEPKLVAEVSFDSWTEDGHLRAPVFVRLRDDVEPASVKTGPAKKNARLKSASGRTSGGTSNKTSSKTFGTTSRATPKNDIEAVLEQLAGKSNRLDLTVGHGTGTVKIRLTNLDREYWPADPQSRSPAITKREYLGYLAGVSPYMLPHLRDRPLTMIRMPEGIGGERFFQKHWDQERPEFVETVSTFSEHVGGAHDYILAHNLPTLLWLGQLGTLEFHVWHSRARVGKDSLSKSEDYSSSLEAMTASVLNYPDYLVFDLDPYVYSGLEARGAEPEYNKKGFAMGKRVAFWINDLLKQMSLRAVVKTSGKTGLHVFVPIERTVTFDEARTLCEMVGRHILRQHPRDVTLEWVTQKRTGKIFIDYNMNVRGKTLNVAYSPRGVPGAPVSMPLTWDELEAAEPGHFRLRNVLARLEKTGDRWHDVLSAKQSLAKAFRSKARK